MSINLAVIVAGLFAAGAALIAANNVLHRVDSSRQQASWLKYGVYVLLVTTFLFLASVGWWVVALLLLIVATIGSMEIYRHLKRQPVSSMIISIATFIILAVCLGHLVIETGQPWYPAFAFVFLIVSIMDSYAQLWGRLLGRHRLCPRLSPGKTWEGLIGGYLTVLVAAYILGFLFSGQSTTVIAIFALVVATGAVAGDLLFSYVKRTLGIKDFSGLLPGHGGVLDRFDSLIVAAPLAHWTMRMMAP